MKFYRHYYLILIFLLVSFPLEAQLSVIADTFFICEGEEVNFSIEPVDSYDTITSAVWDFGSGQGTASGLTQAHFYDEPGSYNVNVNINGHTSISLTNPMVVAPSPDADFFYTDSTETGPNSVYFHPVPQETNIATYKWDFGDGSNAYSTSILHDFPDKGSYNVSLILQNVNGCSDTVIKVVNVYELFEIPNVFSPNDDGVNDNFLVRTGGNDIYSFSVYSRSGVLLYRSESPVIQWDGRTQSGILLKPGVYFYVISRLNTEGEFKKSGFVHLFR